MIKSTHLLFAATTLLAACDKNPSDELAFDQRDKVTHTLQKTTREPHMMTPAFTITNQTYLRVLSQKYNKTEGAVDGFIATNILFADNAIEISYCNVNHSLESDQGRPVKKDIYIRNAAGVFVYSNSIFTSDKAPQIPTDTSSIELIRPGEEQNIMSHYTQEKGFSFQSTVIGNFGL